MAKRYVWKKKKGGRAQLRPWAILAGAAALLLLIGLCVGLSSCRKDEAPRETWGLWDGGWYQDDLARIEDDGALVKGMEAFEKRTGEKPFLTLLDGLDPTALDGFAADQYEALFDGGGHVLVVYDEWGEDEYYLSARTGPESPLTEADVTALLSCLEEAYADPANGSYAQAFGAGFARAAETVSAQAKGSAGVWVLLLLLVLLLLGAGSVLFLRKKGRRTGRRTRADG